MSRVLVTGGAGFIGSHLVHALADQGHQVAILDNFSTGKPENLAGIRESLDVITGDIRDADAIREAVKNVEVVFHQAAFVSVPMSMQTPQECLDVNVHGTELLLGEAQRAGVRRVVLASSAAVYGDADELPLQECTPGRPLSPYAASKQVNEIYAGLFSTAFNLEVVALRYFNVYGPRQSPDSVYAAVVPIFARQFIHKKPVVIHGDGGQTRDLVFVGDVVRANLLAAQAPGAAGEVFNICTGLEVSVQDLVSAFEQVFETSVERSYSEARSGDIYRSVGSAEKAAQGLGFMAQTNLVDGLKEVAEWMKP